MTKALLVALLLLWAHARAEVRFTVIGDYGSGNVNESNVAAMINAWHPRFIITTGDNSYGYANVDLNIGQFYAAFIGMYSGAYGPGSAKNRYFPSLGNHDYSDGGGIAAYLTYFTLPGDDIQTTGTSGNERYYDFVVGPVHFFVINSNYQEPDGTSASSPQALWLQTRLVESQIPWKVVYMHHPPYSSGRHGSSTYMRWPFEDWGASIVLTGHDHTYERIMRDDNADGDSLAYCVNGLGGMSIYEFPLANRVAGSAVRYNGAYGAQFVTATDSTLTLRFVAVNGAIADSLTIRRTQPCCRDFVGNVDGMNGVDIADLTAMIDHLNGYYLIPCSGEGNADRTGIIDLVDLTLLVGYLSGEYTLPSCPSLPVTTSTP